MKVYILILTGQGDTYVRVIDKEAWEWIFSPSPSFPAGKYEAFDPTTPQSVLDALKKEYKDSNAPDVRVSSGSCDNDRALLCYSNIPGYKGNYNSVKSALKAIEKRGDTVKDTYEGYIY